MGDYVRELRRQVPPGALLQVPSVSVAVRDEAGRILVARHAEAGAWVLPGGAVEPGETPADAAVRETWEEAGLLVHLTRLVGVFGGPEFVVQYRSGDRTSYVMSVFEARAAGGAARADGVELLELRWVGKDEWSALPWAAWAPPVLAAVFGPEPGAAFAPAAWTPAAGTP